MFSQVRTWSRLKTLLIGYRGYPTASAEQKRGLGEPSAVPRERAELPYVAFFSVLLST